MALLKKIVIIIAVILIVFGIGISVFIKTLDLNRYKMRIQQQISKSIGQDVGIKNLSFTFSLNRGLRLDISGLAVKDHPEFSSDDLFYVDSAHIDLDVLFFIMKRQIHIQKIELHSPRVNVVRDQAGKINYQQIGQKKNASANIPGNPPSHGQGARATSDNDGTSVSLGDLLIRSVRVTDGTFVFTDQSVSPPVKIPVTRIGFEISNLTLNTAFPVELSASLWSDQDNVRIGGLVQASSLNRQIRIDDLKIQSDLSQLSFARIQESVPALKEAGIKDIVGGRFEMNIAQMVLGTKGLLVFSVDGRLTDGQAVFQDVPIPIKDFNMEFEVSESDVNVKKIELPLARGFIVAEGRILDYLTEQKFTADITLKDVDLGELTRLADFPVRVDGTVYGDFSGDGTGLSKKQLETSLTGEGSAEVKDGVVRDVNILKTVLSKLSFIPNVVERIEQSLPGKYKEKLKQNDTALEQVKIKMRLREGSLRINNAEVSADGFSVIARGALDFNQNLNLEADLFIPEDLSESMVSASQELSYFLDDRKRIHIPFKPYKGKLKSFIMYPDIEDIGKEIIRGRGRDELQKVLRKALDIPEQPADQPADSPQGPQEEKEMSPEEAVIQNILDRIPIFQ